MTPEQAFENRKRPIPDGTFLESKIEALGKIAFCNGWISSCEHLLKHLENKGVDANTRALILDFYQQAE